MPGVSIRGSLQHGCCSLGPMDGFTPSPERYPRCLTRTHGNNVKPNSTLRTLVVQILGIFPAFALFLFGQNGGDFAQYAIDIGG